jgi:hypothetical protein
VAVVDATGSGIAQSVVNRHVYQFQSPWVGLESSDGPAGHAGATDGPENSFFIHDSSPFLYFVLVYI